MTAPGASSCKVLYLQRRLKQNKDAGGVLVTHRHLCEG